jgi:flagellar biosynthesis protein FlhA
VIGRRTVEPVSGAEAFWITPMQKHRAETMKYTIVEPPMVLMSHLGQIIRRNAATLLSRQQVSRMLEALASSATNLVAEVNEKVPTHIVHKVLGNLLSERVPIRDLETVLEGLCEGAGRSDDPEVLTEHVRGQLGRSLSQQYCGDDGKLWCVSLTAGTEDAIQTRLDDGGDAGGDTEPELTARVSRAVFDALGRLRKRGRRPVVLCTPRVRLHLKQILGPTDPDVAVLGYNEIQSVEVQRLENVGVDL